MKLNGKYGCIDRNGKVIIPIIYDWASGFVKGQGLVKLNEKWGYIDKTGKIVIPIKYDQVGFFFEDKLERIIFNGNWGYIDRNGTEYFEQFTTTLF